MPQETKYFVLRCGRCRLIHPYEHTQCLRCGSTEATVARARREEVLHAALQFLVTPQCVAMPLDLALARQARQAAAPSLAGRVQEWVLSIGERVAAAVGGVRPAARVAGASTRTPGR